MSRTPDTLVVQGGAPVTGVVRTPGDKSISHRALLLSALAAGTSTITGLSDGDDVARTAAALVALGAEVVPPAAPGQPVTVHGGRHKLVAPVGPIDCGNSGTGLRLLAGLVAGLPFTTELTGDQSLSARPMDRIAEPLGAMGATVTGTGQRVLPPLTITGGDLTGIDWTMTVASAQVKSALLLAGLSATGETVVREPVATRTHTEEMLTEAGADLTVEGWGSGSVVRVRASALAPRDWSVPGDPSQAAFWVVAACLAAGSAVTVAHVYAGPSRLGFVSVLQRMGAAIEVRTTSTTTADLVARSGPLSGTTVEAAEIPSVDEVPILAVAAAAAAGRTEFRQVGELRVKEVDRLEATARLVRNLGATATIDGDSLIIDGLGGAAHLAQGTFDSGGDHRMAMAAAVAGLAAGPGERTVTGFSAVATSYPGFADDLARLRRPATDGSGIVAIDGPAGSGKSTVSRAVAERLGVRRLDTGAMYRAVAWETLAQGVDPADAEAVAALARSAVLALDGRRVVVNGHDVTEAIRRPEVSTTVSVVAANPGVRAAMVERQRQWAVAQGGRGVVEGRDIGTVVFPDARLKVYLTASPEERARRRAEEAPGGVARRDHLDSTRSASPLYQAPDAQLLDTTDRSVEDVVEEVLSWL